MNYTYQLEPVSALWDEIQPLLEAHWREIAHYPDIPLKPDKEVYEQIEQAGQLRCYTVREKSLVGYVVFFVRANPHYSTSLQASQDVLFVLPEHREKGVGVRLILFAEEQLKAESVQVIYHHVKRTNRVGELLVRLGYNLVDEIYAKRLD